MRFDKGTRAKFHSTETHPLPKTKSQRVGHPKRHPAGGVPPPLHRASEAETPTLALTSKNYTVN
jgi:hypothetical protein